MVEKKNAHRGSNDGGNWWKRKGSKICIEMISWVFKTKSFITFYTFCAFAQKFQLFDEWNKIFGAIISKMQLVKYFARLFQKCGFGAKIWKIRLVNQLVLIVSDIVFRIHSLLLKVIWSAGKAWLKLYSLKKRNTLDMILLQEKFA